jgi:hypothetical protein
MKIENRLSTLTNEIKENLSLLVTAVHY